MSLPLARPWTQKVLPGRGNTIQLKTTSGGVVHYIASTETEVVEWVSAIEGAMAKIHKTIAGECHVPGLCGCCWSEIGGDGEAGVWIGRASARALSPVVGHVITTGPTGHPTTTEDLHGVLS